VSQPPAFAVHVRGAQAPCAVRQIGVGSVERVVYRLCFDLRMVGLWNTLVAWPVRARVVCVLYTVHVCRVVFLSRRVGMFR